MREKIKDIKIYSQENKGLTKTYNTLLEKVTGKYLFILDSDDYIHPQTLEVAEHFMKNEDIDIVEFFYERVKIKKTEFNFVDKNKQKVLLINNMEEFFSRKKARGQWITKWNKLYRFEKIKDIKFDETLTYEDDFWFSSVVLSVIKTKLIIFNSFYFYRVNNLGLTSNINFHKYVCSGINRIQLSYNYFIKENRVNANYINYFKYDLANDAYRMILVKNLKKNKDDRSRKELFLLAIETLDMYLKKGIIETKYLSFFKKVILFLSLRKKYLLAFLLVKLRIG